MTMIDRLPNGSRPRLLPLGVYCALYGDSRSTAYRRHKAGKLRLVKRGGRTLVDVDSAEADAASLPELVPAGARSQKDAA